MNKTEGIQIIKKLSFAELTVFVMPVGNDYHILFRGGGRPHIGCCVLAIPRKSLTGDGRGSCTSSVINVTGHKDEQICRHLAEILCIQKEAVTVCSGGFHMDHITPQQIEELMEAVKEISKEIIYKLKDS